MHDLVIYGAGGLGREVAEIVRRINERHRFWNLLGFVDDAEGQENLGGYVQLGGMDFLKTFGSPLDVALAIASPKAKRRIYGELKVCPHIHFPSVIDVDVTLSSRIEMEEGVILSHFCSVSVETRLGRCVFLNTGTHIGHDTVIGDFCSIMPSVDISGNVTVGEETLIGVGSVILQGKKIGARATVGMGSVVLADVPDNCTVLGNPARKF
ncbi:MAG: acetyltransferase [Synergistaceae bacterium]|nr:acetyltransferase [Synergistaceae bacterium]